MKTDNLHSCVRRHERFIFFLLPIIVFSLLAGGVRAQNNGDSNRYQERGKLTEVEKSNASTTVIIEGKGYLVDSSALVVNAADRPISLDKLSIPSVVHFEFSYMESKPKQVEPFIVYIKETKKNSDSKRSLE